MFNGVFGHKPTARIIPITGHYPMIYIDDRINEFLTIGPMTRYSEDLLVMMKVLTGDLCKELRLDQPVDVKNIKIMYVKDSSTSITMLPVQKDITQGVIDAVKYLKDLGCQVKETNFEDLPEAFTMAFALFADVKGLPNLLEDPSNTKVSVKAHIKKPIDMFVFRPKTTYTSNC